jgi:DnaJ-class molecular chaperone
MRFRPEIDYYEILQVHPRASQEMVKKAYRTLMGEMGAHPDLGGDVEHAKLINEAYAVVGDTIRHAPCACRGDPAAPSPSVEAVGGGEAPNSKRSPDL